MREDFTFPSHDGITQIHAIRWTPESGEVRDEETLAANKTRLESLVKELRGYPDQRARAKAFLQKAADLSSN